MMMMNLKEIRESLERRKGRRQQVREDLRSAKLSLRSARRELLDVERARVIIQLAGKRTQEQLQYHLSEIARLALAAVFPEDPYDFEIAFETRRGRTEADFWFVREGQRIDPRTNVGIGAVDVAGTSLRISLWSLKRPRSRSSIWIDEPARHLKGETPNKAFLEIFKEVCTPNSRRRWEGIQLVVVSDERSSRDDLLEASDRMFEFKKVGRETHVQQL